MKILNSIIATVLVTMLCSFIIQPILWDVPAEFISKRNPIIKTEKVMAEGKMHYKQVCAGCHGEKGKGDGAKIKNLANIKPASLILNDFTSETDGEHFYKVKYGRNRNHSFGGKLDDEAIWSVVHYMKTFSNK